MEFHDNETGWTAQEGEKIQVENRNGEKTDFYVHRIWWYPGMLLIGKESMELYPTKPPQPAKETLLANFEARGEVYAALDTVIAALEQREFKKGSLRLKPGDTPLVTDQNEKNRERLRVFKIINGMLILTDTNSNGSDLGLLDRLMMAWSVFKGDFFKK